MHFKWYGFSQMEASTAISMLAFRHRVFGDAELYAAQEVDDADKISSHLCVFDNNEIVACLRLSQLKGITGSDTYDIGRICVRSDYRGQSIAKKMLGMAVIRGMGNGLEARFETRAPVYLMELYKAVGFEPMGDPYRENDVPHLRLKLVQPDLMETKRVDIKRRPLGQFRQSR